jgi:cytochrome c oxidase assembly protein subunit 15
MASTAIAPSPVLAPLPRYLPRLAWSLLGFMLIVVLWGAVVRATGSGDGCGSHWPLCNGDFLPLHPRLTTLIEFLHRSQTGVLTAGFVVLLVAIFRVTPRHHPARKPMLWATFFLVTEALLGAVLVLNHLVEHNTSALRVAMQSIHFTNTMLLIASLALTAWALQPGTPRAELPGASRTVAVLAVFSTIVVGATGSLAALADTLFPSPSLSAAIAQDFAASSPLLIRMRWLHPASALVSFICVVLLVRASPRFRTPLLLLLAAQVVLGCADVLLLAPIWLQLLHLLTADLYWIVLVLLASSSLSRPPRVSTCKCPGHEMGPGHST